MKRTNSVADALNDGVAVVDVGDGIEVEIPLSGPPVIEDPARPGFYIVNNPTRLPEDPARPGFYLIGA